MDCVIKNGINHYCSVLNLKISMNVIKVENIFLVHVYAYGSPFLQ